MTNDEALTLAKQSDPVHQYAPPAVGALAGLLVFGPVGALAGAGIGFIGRYLYDKKVAASAPAADDAKHTAILNAALLVKDPAKLETLAKGFDAVGKPEQATLLRKRANLRTLPAPVKAARKQAFKNALKSKDAAAIEKVAASFDAEGATGAAEALRQHAADVRKAG